MASAEQAIPIDHQSLEYATHVGLGAMAALTNLVMTGEIKVYKKPDGSDVTDADLLIRDYLRSSYEGDSDVELHSEEHPYPGPPSSDPSVLRVHADEFDGSTNFWRGYTQWRAKRATPLPRSSAFISLGGIHPGDERPVWGFAAAPYLRDGLWSYSAELGGKAVRTDITNGAERELPPVSERDGQTEGSVILLASERSAQRFREPLERLGFDAIVQDATVANILSVCDTELFEQCNPGVLQGRRVEGAFMGGCYDWDVAGALAVAGAVNVVATGLTGQTHTLGQGERGAIFATNPEVHEKLVGIVNAS